jgi:hypothetical protein
MNVNWWLADLAFLLGLVITLVFMIRRVEREVPVYGTSGRGGGGASAVGLANAKPKVAAPAADAPDLDISDVDVPKADLPTSEAGAATATAGAAGGAADSDADAPTTAVPKVGGSGAGTVAAAGAGAAGGVAAAKLVGSGGGAGDSETAKIAAVGDEPYGAGSVRVARGATAPSGYAIKGNEDSMLYHTTDSPSYQQTIAEVWFREESAAQRAGFTRWDHGRAATGGTAAKIAEMPPGPHGPGSATPGPGGSGPEGWTVKGNEDSMLYHSPESPSYQRTIAEVWFRDVETAEAAAFNRWDSGKSQRGQV